MVPAIEFLSVIRMCYKREIFVICQLIVSGKSSMNAIVATFLRTITDIPSIFRALSTKELRKLPLNHVKQRNTE
jgi:hypothetical protein